VLVGVLGIHYPYRPTSALGYEPDPLRADSVTHVVSAVFVYLDQS
jgi:hypothetical protein